MPTRGSVGSFLEIARRPLFSKILTVPPWDPDWLVGWLKKRRRSWRGGAVAALLASLNIVVRLDSNQRAGYACHRDLACCARILVDSVRTFRTPSPAVLVLDAVCRDHLASLSPEIVFSFSLLAADSSHQSNALTRLTWFICTGQRKEAAHSTRYSRYNRLLFCKATLEDRCSKMPRPRLSAIEFAILKGLANGLQSKEIAAVVNRSTATIELHVRTLYARFDARSRAQLVAYALCRGAICPEDIDGPEDDAVPVGRVRSSFG